MDQPKNIDTNKTRKNSREFYNIFYLFYPFVDIFISNNKEAEFLACYRKEEGGSPAYVIGAVFNKQSKKFGFHS